MDLAMSLKDVGSAAFALEVIKKYTPIPKDEMLECPLLLLKTEILMELDEYDEAIELIEKVYHIADGSKDQQTRYSIMAECRNCRFKYTS